MGTKPRKTKRATPRRKSTIRKMTPLARKMAHLTRAVDTIKARLARLTEELYELERAERAAQAQIKGHALVCPLTRQPDDELFPELPNGEGELGAEAQACGPDSYVTASEIEQGPQE